MQRESNLFRWKFLLVPLQSFKNSCDECNNSFTRQLFRSVLRNCLADLNGNHIEKRNENISIENHQGISV